MQVRYRYIERFPKVADLHWLDQAGYVILAYLIIFSLSEPAQVAVQTVSVAVQTVTAPKPTGDLAELFKDHNSVGTLAICAAEGNCDLEGNKLTNYLGHVDPGNSLRNMGHCSAQPYLLKDHNRNGKIDISDADTTCLLRHQQSLKFQAQKFRNVGLNPEEHIEALVAAVDLYNQASPWVSYQFVDKYSEVIKTGQTGTDAITEARVQSFRRKGELSAGGLFRVCSNSSNALGQNLPGEFRSEPWRHECIRRDQARRQKNIAAVLKASGY